MPLTTIAQAIQKIEMLRKHRRTNWTAEQGQERFYERPGTFFATVEQTADIAISLCKQF